MSELDGDALDAAVSPEQPKAHRQNRSSQIITNDHVKEVARIPDGRQTVTPRYFKENKSATTIDHTTQCDVLCHESQDSKIYRGEN